MRSSGAAHRLERSCSRTRAVHSIAALTWGRVVEGNAVRIIQESAFFDELLREMEQASHHIHLETFLWENGFVSDRVIILIRNFALRWAVSG